MRTDLRGLGPLARLYTLRRSTERKESVPVLHVHSNRPAEGGDQPAVLGPTTWVDVGLAEDGVDTTYSCRWQLQLRSARRTLRARA